MRTVPGMTVICPADAQEARLAVKAAYEMEGPVYLRFGRMAVPVLFDEDYKFEIGKGVKLVDGTDVSIIANGVEVEQALIAAEALKAEDYTSDSFANVQAILASAKAMLTSKSQDAVDATTKALEDMMAALVKKAGATVVALDYTRLNAAIAAAEALKADEYTAASWAAVKAALDIAKAATTSTSQAVINSAAQALEINMIGLVKPVVTPPVTPEQPEDTTPDDTTPEDTTPEDTTPEDTTPKPTEKPSETQKPAGNGGCGSVIAGAAVVMAIVLTLGTGIVIKKKED